MVHVVNLIQPRFTLKGSPSKGLPRLGWLVIMSMEDNHNYTN